MAQDAMNQMKFDKSLEKDIEKAGTYDDLMGLLHNAIERSPELGITRDPVTGKFVARDKEAPPAAARAAADAAPRVFEKKGVVIGGQKFDFSASSELELARQIAAANEVAAALASDESVTPRSARHAASRTSEEIAVARSEAEIALRQGTISTAEFLERTGAFDEYLSARGVDVAKISQDQLNEAWQAAAETFRNSAEGADWPGGIRNRQILSDKLAAMGLADEPSAASLSKAYAALKAAGTLFYADHDATEMEKLAKDSNASPQEILQAWKESVQKDVHGGDATEANSAFIKNFGGSSSVFDR
jgi:hypothetical protein